MRQFDPIHVAAGLAGGVCLVVLFFVLVQGITNHLKKRLRKSKVQKIATNLVAQRAKQTRHLPKGARCFVFNDSGQIVHEDRIRLTKSEIRSHGGSGQIIASNRKIALTKWEKLFGKPISNQ